MRKAFKKLKSNFVNKFKYFLNIAVRLLTLLFQVSAICFPMSIGLIVVNSLLGVHIRLNYYLIMAIVATASISLILTIINWKKIIKVDFVKQSRVVNKIDSKNKSQKVQRRKRKIS